MSKNKFDVCLLQPENLKDEVLFPMGHRLSFISSPESDVDMAQSAYDDEPDYGHGGGSMQPSHRKPQMIRSSSDPSIATQDNIPGLSIHPLTAMPYGRPDTSYTVCELDVW